MARVNLMLPKYKYKFVALLIYFLYPTTLIAVYFFSNYFNACKTNVEVILVIVSSFDIIRKKLGVSVEL